MYEYKPDDAETRSRLRAFWQGESFGDRPALLAFARNKTFVPTPWQGPALTRKQKDFDPDWHAWSQCENVRSYDCFAEATPSVNVNVGGLLTVLAVLAGGDYEYHDSAWIQPWPDVLDNPVPQFDPACDAVRKWTACYRKLAEAVGSDAHVNPPVQIDALTTLSMFIGPDALCVSLLEEPEKVKRWTRDATSLYIACTDYFSRLLNGLGHAGSTSWLGTYSEGNMDAVQCDFAVMLSPEMFGEFVMPDLRRTTAFMRDALYHLDGTEQMRFIEQIASSPNLRGIQWNPAKHALHPSEHMAHFKRIRELGLSLFTWVESVEHAVYITEQLGPDGLCLGLPRFETEPEARAAIAAVERCRKR